MTYQIQKTDNSFTDNLSFFSSIDDNTKEWLNSLNHIWQLWKKCDSVSKTLMEYFESAPNPYLSTIRILVNTPDFKHIKANSSLAFTVIEEYAKWLEPRKDMYNHFLVLDLKIAAFQLIITQNNMEFIKMVAVTYNFIEHKEQFLDIILKTIQEKKYKEAAQYIAMLQLQEYFLNPETLLIPLMLQNKLTIVEDVLANCPEMQKAFVMYLDNLIKPDNNMHIMLEDLIKKNNIPDVKMSTMQIKPMIKLIARFVKLYNLPSECCPNSNNKRCEGTLQFLIHKRYVDGSLSTASWREMVQETIGNDAKLQLHMIRMLINAKDAKEGLYWAKKFDVPKEQWPWAITYEDEQAESEGVNEGASTSRGELSNDEITEDVTNCHEMKLSRDSIKIIDNAQSFEEFLDYGLQNVNIVGIDSEWKPCFGTKQTELALIQIATETNVYILDVTTMGNEAAELWTELALILFENKSILKLGFGIAQDMTVIRDSLPALSKIKTYGQGYLDIVHLWQKLVNDYKFVFPHESDQQFSKQSLSKLVELCLGQKLNKSDQFSNWEQRPLREGQIIYAALDAFCLLEIYTVLEEQCERLDIPFLDICIELQHIPHRSPKRNAKKPKQNTNVIGNKAPNDKQQRFRNDQRPNYQNRQEHLREPVQSNNSMQPNKPLSQLRKQHFLNKQKIEEAQSYQVMINEPRIPAHSWRVICDPMLGGLCSQLRMCGCDCIHNAYDRNGGGSIRIAMNTNRVLLTRNRNYLRFPKYLMPDKHYSVIAERPEDQLREVLKYFNIYVTKRDIFSRCKVCNCDEFVKVPKSLMDRLIQRHASSLQLGYANLSDLTELSQNSQTNCYANNGAEYEDRTWILNTYAIMVNTCLTKYHAKVQIDKVPISVFKHVHAFYVCERCGHIYWNGSHSERTLNNMIGDIIST